MTSNKYIFPFQDAKSILLKCQRENPPRAPELFSVILHKSILLKYIEALLNTLKPKEAREQPFEFEQRIHSEKQKQNDLANEFIANFGHQLPCQHGVPLIIRKIEEAISGLSQARSILDECQRDNSSQGLSLFEGEPQISLLVKYIDASLNTLKPKNPQEQDLEFEQRIARTYAHQQQLAQEFKTKFLEKLPSDKGEPLILLKIDQLLKAKEQAEKQTKIQNIRRIYPFTTEEQLSALPLISLEHLNYHLKDFIQKIESSTAVIERLCSRAGIDSKKISVQFRDKAQVSSLSSRVKQSFGLFANLLKKPKSLDSYLNNPFQNLEIRLEAADEVAGYTVHHLLKDAGIIDKKAIFSGPVLRNVKDPIIFKLTPIQFDLLQKKLANLEQGYQEFDHVLSQLLASDAQAYLKIGSNPLSGQAHHQSLSSLIDNNIMRRLRTYGHQELLELTQVAIDLNAHPEKDQMRTLIQMIYEICDLKDANNQAKTFIKDASGRAGFISYLSVDQIRQISDEMISLSQFALYAKDSGFESIFALVRHRSAQQNIEIKDVKLCYLSYLDKKFTEFCAQHSPAKPLQDPRTRTLMPPQAQPLFKVNELNSELINHFLNKKLNIQCSAATSNANQAPSSPEKYALLGSSGFIRDPKITNNHRLRATFTKLKQSPKYLMMSQAYDRYYQALGAKPKPALTRSCQPNGIEMLPSLDLCLDALLDAFLKRPHDDDLQFAKDVWLKIVMKIVYAEKMQISDGIIQRGAEFFAQMFKPSHEQDNLEGVSNAVFAHRCLRIEGQLIAGEDDPFKLFITQLLMDKVNQAFALTFDMNSHDSLRLKPIITEYLGLEKNTLSGRSSINPRDLSRFMQELASLYTVEEVFIACYRHFCDEFKVFVSRNDTIGLKKLLMSLGYSEHDFKTLSVDGQWNIESFQDSFNQQLVHNLLNKNIIQLPAAGSVGGRMIIKGYNSATQVYVPFKKVLNCSVVASGLSPKLLSPGNNKHQLNLSNRL